MPTVCCFFEIYSIATTKYLENIWDFVSTWRKISESNVYDFNGEESKETRKRSKDNRQSVKCNKGYIQQYHNQMLTIEAPSNNLNNPPDIRFACCH